MPEKDLFEYAIVRIVPKVEREEFINVGVIVYCAKQKFLQALFTINEERLRAFCTKTDLAELKEHLDSYNNICKGTPGSGPIGQLDLASRFRWLTATRSTVVQSSKVHPGLCEDATETLQKLFAQLVL
jgi:hypothetical protein